jgi:formiminotetrahydrofolate cyclodeaminase
MVVAYSIGKNTEPETRAKLEDALVALRGLDELMRALITRDAQAYEESTSAARKMKEHNSPEHQATYQQSLLGALAVPMEIAAIASRMLALMNAQRERFNRRLLSDLGVLASLAEASAIAAGFTVEANLSDLADPSVRERISAELDVILGHCSEFCQNIDEFINAVLEQI